VSRRHVNKRAAHAVKVARSMLLDAAGRQETPLRSATIAFVRTQAEFMRRRVSVPRSLRPVLGRWVGA